MNQNAPGQTPLDHDASRGLRLSYVATRGELDAAEQANIVRGQAWAWRRRLTVEGILDDGFLRRLHREMFGDVWRWAGVYRQTNTNIGMDWQLGIAEAVRNLCQDASLWLGSTRDAAAVDAAAIEFHHRLVLVHPFVNGNGRHARLVADLLARASGAREFSWGGSETAMPTEDGDPVRTAYLTALRAADNGDPRPLVRFARS